MNWFIKAQENEKKPYRLVRVMGDATVPLGRLKDKIVWAVSAKQALAIFRQTYGNIMDDYEQMSFEIDVVLDIEEMNRVKRLKQYEEEEIQDAWWQK